MLSKLNPFRGLPNPKEVAAWSLYDLANQSFTLIIITLLFPLYIRNVAVVDDPDVFGDRVWSWMQGGCLIVVVLVSPIIGALADGAGRKKTFLIGTGIVCAAFTASFALIGPGDWRLAIPLFLVAGLAYQIGENFLASFLPLVSTRQNIGRVSATGWATGYVGSILLLVVVAGGVFFLDMEETATWRPFFVFSGIWFALWMIPAAIVLKETRPEMRAVGARAVLKEAHARIKDTVGQAARYRQLVRFLTAFFVYALGVQTMIAFMVIIAERLGITTKELPLFSLQIAVTAGLAAFFVGCVQDRIGARNTLFIVLGVWIATCAALFALAIPESPPKWLFWVVGNGAGLGLGGVGTASRAMVGLFTPRQKTAEFFGLWGMTYKAAGAAGVLAFGAVVSSLGLPASLALLTAFFALGAVLLLRVDVSQGVRAAEEAEQERLVTPEDVAAEVARTDSVG